MEVVVDVRALQSFVMRIVDLEGHVLGTGFVAAPGRVLTNAHVLKDHREVQLRPEVPQGVLEGRGTVKARSRGPEGSDQPLWPFPDVAIIETEDFSEHACVLFDAAVASLTSDFVKGCVAWGYPQRAGEKNPEGDPVECEVVGPGSAASPYWRVKGDWVGRGISGAPVVSRDRGAVVGILTATLNPKGSSGGWFVPLGDVASAPDVDADLKLLIQEVIASSQAAVVGRPDRWSSVIRLPASEGIAQSGGRERFIRGEHTSPAELLLADNAIVDYLFYSDELDAVEAWACGPAGLRMAVLAGAGGAGKSRFALELTLRLSRQGWVCADFDELDDADALAITSAPVPRLIVVDYAENRSADVDRLLKRLLRGTSAAAPARVLLLTREPADAAAWASRPSGTLPENSSDAGVRRVLGERRTIHSTTRPLSVAERGTLYRTAVTQLAATWTGEVVEPQEADLTDDQYSTALAVIYAALDAVLQEELPDSEVGPDHHDHVDDVDGVSRLVSSPADRVLAHEARYWALTAPDGVSGDEAELAISVLTLFAGEKVGDIAPLLETAGFSALAARTLGTWAGTFYRDAAGSRGSARFAGGDTAVQPLRPDRLGERLVERALVIGDQSPDLVSLLKAATPAQCAHAVEVLARAAVYSPPVRQELTRIIGLLMTDLTERAAAAPAGRDETSGASVLAVALIELLTGPLGPEILGATPVGSAP